MLLSLPFLTAAALTLLQVIVLVWDLIRYRIPNFLSLALAGLFIPYALLVSLDGWYWNLLIGVIVLVVCYLLFILKAIGGGDAKWLAACSLWTGAGATLPFLAMTALIGGIFTVVLLLIRGILRGMVGRREDLPQLFRPFGPVPYGVAIALAFILTLWQGAISGLEGITLSLLHP